MNKWGCEMHRVGAKDEDLEKMKRKKKSVILCSYEGMVEEMIKSQ